ncbi:MAG: hypothetical protein COB19_04195 [Porticoccus sp.]|nr:MAG: hypothetical protein COB19_04195 [Porticoccus sp.]
MAQDYITNMAKSAYHETLQPDSSSLHHFDANYIKQIPIWCKRPPCQTDNLLFYLTDTNGMAFASYWHIDCKPLKQTH